MKELTIEERAERYDEVVNKLRRFMEKGVDHLITRADVQDFFPELKESEDERIMKWIIRDINQALEDNVYNGESIDSAKEALAWLEKQGKKGTNGNEREIPFSAWSEEDEEIINNIGEYLNCYGNYIADKNEEKAAKIYKSADWLKSLKDRYTWKPSEEQIKSLQESIGIVGELTPRGECLKELVEQLKKLREE